MLRELQVQEFKNINAMCKATEALVTGMGVIKDDVNKTVSKPTEDIVDGFYFVNKERVFEGLNAARLDASDYDEAFVKIEADELVKLTAPQVGERYGTDNYNKDELTDETAGVRVAVGTDGCFKKATEASRYVFTGITLDAGHALAVIEVTSSAKANG